jgi:hypothetical protein
MERSLGSDNPDTRSLGNRVDQPRKFDDVTGTDLISEGRERVQGRRQFDALPPAQLVGVLKIQIDPKLRGPRFLAMRWHSVPNPRSLLHELRGLRV